MARTQNTADVQSKAPEGTESTEAEASPQQESANEQAAQNGPSEVKYVGAAGTREISKADWKAAGIEHDTVTWNAENEYSLPASKFSEEALTLLKRDRNLRIK